MEEARAGFGVQWARWREGYERAASAQPLPRGWLRQMEPGGGECFVNTRTAERQVWDAFEKCASHGGTYFFLRSDSGGEEDFEGVREF